MTHYGARERSFRGKRENPYNFIRHANGHAILCRKKWDDSDSKENAGMKKRAHDAPFRYIPHDTSRGEWLR